MSTPAETNDNDSVLSYLKSLTGQSLPYRELLDRLEQLIPCVEAMILSTVPRGGLQIVQPPRLSDGLVRRYCKNGELHDRLSWEAIRRNEPVTITQAWVADWDGNLFNISFMAVNGFVHAIALPLAAPLLDGYPGALHVYRSGSQKDFSADEILALSEFARELSDAIVRCRRARVTDRRDSTSSPVPALFIFDKELRSLLPAADPDKLDGELAQNMRQHARQCFARVNGSVTNDRVPLSHSRGDLWNFRVVVHPSYPALSDQPVAFFALQPACTDWSILRPSDFQADDEIARLIPAVRFMREQFHRRPTLVEIARTVHLSPFHFHRRFTELMGITPKHLLLDYQIQQAKRDLIDVQKALAGIASACGFAHQSHFTSRFKQATGLTPTRWRRMVQHRAEPV